LRADFCSAFASAPTSRWNVSFTETPSGYTCLKETSVNVFPLML
jgi:hypothetical protein